MNGVADWKVTARFRGRGGARGQYKALLALPSARLHMQQENGKQNGSASTHVVGKCVLPEEKEETNAYDIPYICLSSPSEK